MIILHENVQLGYLGRQVGNVVYMVALQEFVTSSDAKGGTLSEKSRQGGLYYEISSCKHAHSN